MVVVVVVAVPLVAFPAGAQELLLLVSNGYILSTRWTNGFGTCTCSTFQPALDARRAEYVTAWRCTGGSDAVHTDATLPEAIEPFRG